MQEDPKQLLKVELPLPKGQVFERMAWGPDGTIAAALGGHIHFLDSKTGKVCTHSKLLCCNVQASYNTAVIRTADGYDDYYSI